MLRDVTIHAVANGYVVTVGCQTFVFQDRVVMLHEIGAYLTDPEGTEKRYREHEPNMKHTDGGGPVTPPPMLYDGPVAVAPPPLQADVRNERRVPENRLGQAVTERY